MARNLNTTAYHEHIMHLYLDWKHTHYDIPDTMFVRCYLKKEHHIYIDIRTFKRIKQKFFTGDGVSIPQ